MRREGQKFTFGFFADVGESANPLLIFTEKRESEKFWEGGRERVTKSYRFAYKRSFPIFTEMETAQN